MEEVTVKYIDEVVIAIEDCTDQIYQRFEINGVTVLVDGTPDDDPDRLAVEQLISGLGG